MFFRHISIFSITLLIFFLLFLSSSTNVFSLTTMDAPHDTQGCKSCHDMNAFDQPNLIPNPPFPGDPLHVPLDPDDTLYNVICLGCHDGGTATLAFPHSSLTTSTNYGDWSVGCSVCHNQHIQEQDSTYGTTHGGFIKRTIDLSKITGAGKTGYKSVKFTGPTGPDSYAHSDDPAENGIDSTPNGICQVCHDHVNLKHWKSDGTKAAIGVHAKYNGEKCMWCHNHSVGFKANFPDHAVRINEVAFCLSCHPGPEIVEDTHVSECLHCHQPDDYRMQNYLALYQAEPLSIPAGCDECHYGQFNEHVADTGHGKIHDNARLGYDTDDNDINDGYIGCEACHYTDIVQEHSRARAITCSTCHASTTAKVLTAINKGKSPVDGGLNQFVFCDDCHNTATGLPTGNLVDKHHATSFASNGDCTHCHVVGRGINGPVGGPCGDCHGDSRYGNPEYSNAMRHNNALMLNLDNVSDYRVCFSCHLENTQGYRVGVTPIVKPMHALPSINPRYPGDPWNSDQCGDPGCSDGIPNLPACDPPTILQCDNFMEMAGDPVGFITANAGLTADQKTAVFTLSRRTPGYGLYDLLYAQNFGLGGLRSYFNYYTDPPPPNNLRLWLETHAGTNNPYWQHIDAGSTVTVPINYDDGSTVQVYEVFSPDGSGGGGLQAGGGSLAVNITPKAAADAGGKWRYDGLDWQSGGSTFGTGAPGDPFLPPREYQVEFKKISGWVTPEPVRVSIENGKAASVSDTQAQYIPCSTTPALTINVPSDIDWTSPGQVEIFNAEGWYGREVEWALEGGSANGFTITPISPTTVRFEKTGINPEVSYPFSLSAKGSDCYGNSVSTSFTVNILAGGAPSPHPSSQDGMIDGLKDSLSFPVSAAADLKHVGGIYYARLDAAGYLETFSIDAAGMISDAYVDRATKETLGFTYQEANGTTPDILHISGTVYVLGGGRMLRAVSINPINGAITVLPYTFQVDNRVVYTDIFKVTGDVYILIYSFWGNDYYMRTVRIADNGQMSSLSGPWFFDSNAGYANAMFDLVAVGPDTYAMLQIGGSLSTTPTPKPGYVKTLSLGADGSLPYSFIDTYKFDNIQLGHLHLFKLDDKGNYGILYRNNYSDASLKTIQIEADGTIGSPVNTILLEQMQSISGTDFAQISDDVYAFIGPKCYYGDATYCPTMVETYRIQNGRISSQNIDYFTFAQVAWEQATYVDVVHAGGDNYAVANGRDKVFTISIKSDGDGDGVPSLTDNCPSIANSDQIDTDGDGLGDVCDLYPDDPDNDSDGDGVAAGTDICPSDSGNDEDGDGYCIGSGFSGSQTGDNDNCPHISNPDQVDTELDGVGDVCDNCLNDSNTDQSDVDYDGVGDVCDDNADNDAILDDGDNNGIKGDNPCTGGLTNNCDDNCPLVVNDSQIDVDADGIGDACDGVISNSPFTYRRKISLFPATPIADYQIKVSLTPSNFDYSRVKADGSDIMIYDDAENELSHWVENWTPGGTSVIWVKVPVAGTNQISLAYGYDAALSASNGDATFLFFDDFKGSSLNLAKWPQRSGVVVAGSIATLDVYSSFAPGPEDYIYASNYTVPINSITELKHKAASSNTTSRFGITDQRTAFNQDNMNYIGIQLYSDDYTHGLIFFGTNNGGTVTITQSNVSDYEWHINKIIWSTDLAEFYIDNVLKLSDTTNVPTAADTLHPLLRDVSSTDWIRIRKNAATEPVTVIGDEMY